MNKCEESYTVVFNKLKLLEPLQDRISILIDFKIASRNAVTRTPALKYSRMFLPFRTECMEKDYQRVNKRYFNEDNYIGRPMANNHRRRPKFLLSVWNAVSRFQFNLPWKNNAVGGWHTAFQGSLSCNHLTVWLLVETLRREEGLQRTKYLGIISGEPSQKNSRYENLEELKALLNF